VRADKNSKCIIWTFLAVGVGAFLAGIFADGHVSDADVRASGVVLVLLSVGAIAYRRLHSPYRRLGDADLIDVIGHSRHGEGLETPNESQPLVHDGLNL